MSETGKSSKKQSNILTNASKTLLKRPVIAHISTVTPENKPHVTPVWIDVEGDYIVINTAEGRRKSNNLRHNSAVAISVTAPDDPYNAVVLQGAVVEITPEGADAHIDSLAQKYLGKSTYPFRQPGEKRVRLIIQPEHIATQPQDETPG
ncbi:MAG: PPOX class F420-dependent oxidoreductase [Actinobacteria bacterium]|jgi:PPOX class probable F420-dependent enzyme|nr:PPOX class F420-dependent oxidoreductase [Actinomycetota bacterium]MCL6105090.1 PPOX class F420-dependent oxidoreductase [Actinomycetota bacterium]